LSREKLTLKDKLIYGVGAMGMDMSYGLSFSFFMKYCTDVLLVRPLFMGTMIPLANIWDSVNNPIMGTIANNTKGRFGRFRPWVFLGGTLNAIVLFFMFFNPGFKLDDGVNTGLYVYITIFFVLWGTTMTMIDIPYWSFIPTLTNEPHERNVVASVARFFSGVGQLVVMGATPLILLQFAQDKQGQGFMLIAAGLGVMMIITSSITAAGTRERIVPPKEEKVTFMGALHVLRKNDQLLVFLIVIILFNMGWYLMNSLAFYFFDYVAENTKLLTVFAAISGVSQAAGLALMSPLVRRFGKQMVFKGGILTAIIGYLALLFISTRSTLNVPLFFIFDAVACLGIGCVFTAQMSMFADLVDYGEYKQGKRTESIVYSMKNFQMKVAQMIQALIVGYGLSLFKYQENVHPQPESGKLGIVLMMFLIPPVLAVVAYILFARKYKLHSEYLAKVTAKVHGD